MGRISTALLVVGGTTHALCAICISCLHPRHGENEEMFAQVYAWAMSLRCPVLIGGDMNETTKTSAFLSLSDSAGLFRISPNLPTTRRRQGGMSANLALDPILVTHPILDRCVRSWVDHEKWISDHYAIMARWRINSDIVTAWRWPKPMKLENPTDELPWWDQEVPNTYEEWTRKATKWLSRAYNVPAESKTSLVCDVPKAASKSTCLTYSLILKVQNILASVRANGEGSRADALRRINQRFRLLEVRQVESMEDAEVAADHVLKMYLDHAQEKALATWKSKVLTWNAQSGDAYKYLKNVSPAKACVMLTPDGECVSSPQRLGALLSEYWQTVEAWPNNLALTKALELLDDKYSLFLPREELDVRVDARTLHNHFKKASKSSPGPDGWSRKELASLPLIAWEHFMVLWNKMGQGIKRSSLFWFRRVPIEKGAEPIPSPSMFRPIDVYSTILRGVATVQVNSMRAWLGSVLFGTQYASRFGVLEAVGSLNTYAEAAYHGVASLWAISIDYKKLFNTISYVVAIEAARVMGLKLEDALQIQVPSEAGVGLWRLPAKRHHKLLAREIDVSHKDLATSVSPR